MNAVNLFLNLFLGVDMSPILDLLKYKSIHNVINVNCNNRERILWQKILNNNDMRVASLNIQDEYTSSLPYTSSRIGIIVNTSCANWPTVLKYFPVHSAFKNQLIWIVFTEDLELTVNTLSNLTIELDSDVTVISKRNGIYDFHDAFHKHYSSGTFTVRKIGYWNNTLFMTNAGRNDLSGLVIRCAVVITDKIVNENFMEYLVTYKKSKVDSLHKLKFYAMLYYIRDMYNFTYDVLRTNSWGYVRNGSFDGVVGSLTRQESDIGGSSLFFRSDRAQFIDYIAETWDSRQCFILRHPKHPGGIYSIYTRPLTAKVWYCILSILVLTGVILFLLLKTKLPKSRENNFDSSFSLALLFVWSAICQQGMSLSRNSTSVQVVVFVTFVYALTLYQYYNATVVSTLLREPPKNIRTLEDLLRSNLKAGAEDVLYVKDYFKRTTDQIAKNMYHKKIVPDRQYNFFTPARGMALVKRGGFAFHVDSVVAYRIMRSTFTEREICEAHEVPMYPPQKMGLVVRKLSPYKEHFTYGVRKIFESGLMHRLRSVWDEPKPACVHTPDTSIFSVSILEFSTALLALTAGTVTSLIILIGEILLHRLTHPNRILFSH